MSDEKETNDTIGKINSNSEQRDLSFEIPIIDAHMHIQSNDIAPLPIMNGMLRYKTSFTWLPAGFINFAYLSSRNIPNFEYDYDPKTDSIYEEKGGKKKEIFNNNPFRSSIFHKPDFTDRKRLINATAIFSPQYGSVTRHCSFSIAGLYQNENISTNMAYTSRWTKVKTAKQEDINEANKSRKKITDARNDQMWFDNHIQWYKNATKYELKTDKNKEIYSFSSNSKIACVMGMELMYSHFWGAYGIPIYLEDAKGNIYIIDNFPENLNYPYDMDILPINEDGDLDLRKCKEKKCSNSQKYSIFLQKLADKSETYQFEDHFQHVEYQKIAALRYPFQFLPFYHVDPRRFFAPINEIKQKFDFYIPSSKSGIYHKLYDGNENDNNEDMGKIKESVTNIICKRNGGDEPNGISFKYSTSIANVKNELLSKDNSGLFWGVKLYVALGYPPYIGCAGNTNGQLVFPGLNKDTYKDFTDFLGWCGDNDIPVTCHGSPQGMTIADPEIYLKEYLKQNRNSEFKKQLTSEFEPHCKAFMLGLGLIDDFSSPDSWKVVLKEITSTKLRLCLAHFGGKPYFVDEYSMDKDKYAWQKQLVNLIENSDKRIYTDLSNFMFKKCNFKNILTEYEYNKVIKENSSIKKFFNMEIEAGNAFYKTTLELNNLNIYTESQYEDRQNALQIRLAMLESGVVGKDINTAAKHLAELFENTKRLKYRIMFGSDYPMFEGTDGVKGVINYQSSTFIFYQLLTHKLGNKWDAWHQFTVINPLIFLGLIKWDDSSDKSEPESFDIDVKKLNDFKTALKDFNEKVPDDTDLVKDRKMLWDLETKKNIKKNLEKISFSTYIKIPNAKNIVDKKGNMILTGEKRNESKRDNNKSM